MNKFKLLCVTCCAIFVAFAGITVVKADVAWGSLVNLSQNGNRDYRMETPYKNHFLSAKAKTSFSGSLQGELRNDNLFHTLINAVSLNNINTSYYKHIMIHQDNGGGYRWYNAKALKSSYYGNIQFTNTPYTSLPWS